MNRRSKSESPVSLFPFLAVLMCTMGALIMLLLALTTRMRQQVDDAMAEQIRQFAPAAAEPGPESEQPPEPEPVEIPVPKPRPRRQSAEERARLMAERESEQERRLAAWGQSLLEARSLHEKRKNAVMVQYAGLDELDRKLRDAHARLKKIEVKAASIEKAKQAVSDAEGQIEGKDAQLTEQIALARRNIDLANRKQATASNEYSLIPYDGTSGTLRYPIYIECTGRGFRFIPENTFLAADDLIGFTESYNPLLTGSQALSRYWSAKLRATHADTSEPYVLLIVRPSGALAYHIARKLLMTLTTPFGYELVEEDWKLSAPEVDPQAKAVLNDAVEVTLAARARKRDAVASRERGSNGFPGAGREPSRGFTREDFLPGNSGGGFDRGEPGSFGDGQGGAGREFAGGGGTGGTGNGQRGASRGVRPYANGAGDGSGGGGDFGPPDEAGHTLGPAGGGRGSGTGRGGRAGTPRPATLGGGTENGAGYGSGAGEEGGLDGEPGDPAFAQGGGGVPGGRRGPSRGGRRGGPRPATLGGQPVDDFGEEPMDGELGGDDSAGYAPGGYGANRNSPSGQIRRGSKSGIAGRSGGDPGDMPPLVPLPDDVGPGYGHRPRVVASGNSREPGRLRTLESEPEPLAGVADGLDGEGDGGTSAHRSSRGGGNARGSSNSRGGRNAQGGGDGSGGPGDAPSGGNGQGGDAQVGGNAQGGGSGSQGFSPGGGGGQGPGGPQSGGGGAGFSFGNGGGGAESMDEPPRGGKKRWGQPSGRRGGFGLERKVEIHVRSDRLLIGPGDAVIGANPHEKTDDLTKKVLNGIEQSSQGWGAPPANFYWSPSVKFIVYPGGSGYYERLRGPLQKSGVTSTVQYVTEDQPIERTGGGRR